MEHARVVIVGPKFDGPELRMGPAKGSCESPEARRFVRASDSDLRRSFGSHLRRSGPFRQRNHANSSLDTVHAGFCSWCALSSGVIGYESSVRAARHARKGGTMKKAPRKRKSSAAPDMQAEYRLDYSHARPNRFASRMPANAVAVVLDPAVTSVFGSSDSVNALLRSVVKAMPDHAKRRRKAG